MQMPNAVAEPVEFSSETLENLLFSPVATIYVEGALISNCGCEGHECGCGGDCGCDGD